jgi:arylsulfatase
MKRFPYITISCLCATVLMAWGSSPAHAQGEDLSRPNVVLILVDDMGWSDIGCYGSEVATPHLDRLAGEGIRFTQVYNTSKCFPSRACLLTGLYSQRIGYHETYQQPMRHAMTLGELFKMAGYTTLWSGKHHSTEMPTDRGFDHYSGLFEGASNHFNPGRQREGEGKPAQKRNNRPWVIDGEVIQPYTPDKDFYTTDRFTDYALDWLEASKDKNQPFFLYLSYTAPHDPLMAWPEDIAKYRDRYRVGYEAIRRARFEKQKAIGLLPEDHPLSASTFTAWDQLDENEQKEEALKMAVYAAMIDRLDQNIGRLLKKLEEWGVSENTLILFASDNGASAELVKLPGSGEIGSMTRWTSLGPDWANVSNTPLRYFKNWSYEGGIRTPLIAHWPAAIPGENRVVDTPLHFIDFLPTFADLLNISYPDRLNGEALIPLDGISFLPILEGTDIQRSRPLFWQWRKGRAVRDGDWKAVKQRGNWELYNLETDPVEANNLAATKPKILQKLISEYENWTSSHRRTAETGR